MTFPRLNLENEMEQETNFCNEAKGEKGKRTEKFNRIAFQLSFQISFDLERLKKSFSQQNDFVVFVVK